MNNPRLITYQESILYVKKNDYVFLESDNYHLYVVIEVIPFYDFNKIEFSKDKLVYKISDGFLILEKVK